MNNLELFKVHHFDNKVRLGAKNDGGYVIGILNDANYDCYISCGVNNEESFSRDFINKYNWLNEYNCFAFDRTIRGYPYRYTNKISFISKNISDIDDDNFCNLSYLMNKYNNIFLKMDIEGGEYKWLNYVSKDQLKKFKQIVIEFHGLTNDGWDCLYNDKIKCLEKLNQTHFIIHVHGNNYGSIVNGFPDVLEVTYVNKDYFKGIIPEVNKCRLPIEGLDFPNDSNKNDYDLNYKPFTFLKN